MNEYVVVTFPIKRAVLMDGEPCGFTNEVLTIEGGQHTFTLGEPLDYRPESQTVYVENTNIAHRQEVPFEKL